MKFKFLKTCLLSLVLTVSGLANAGLILNITDAGSGNTRWVFSGDTIATGTAGANGFWPAFTGLDPVNTTFNCVNIISGSGSMFTSSSGAVGLLDVCGYTNTDYVSIRTGSVFSWTVGDVLSWNGDIITSVDYTYFNPGSYSTKHSIYGGAEHFSSPFVLNIGPQVDSTVPEPSTLAIFALGMIGLASRRFKKQS